MNLRHIEIFCAVMRCRTTVAAAHELGLSQPAVSSAIKHIEAQIGMQLFERAGNRLIPTVEAHAIYGDAKPLHAMSVSVTRKIVDLRDGMRGHMRILTTQALARSLAAQALADFLRSRKDVQIFIDVRRMEGVIEGVESGFADLGFAIAPPPRPGIETRLIATSQLVAILPRKHPLTSKQVLEPEDLQYCQMVGLEASSRLGALIREWFQQAGAAYSPDVEVHYGTTACALVERGIGAAIVDPFTVGMSNDWNVEVRPIRPVIDVHASVIYLKERPLSRLCKRFIEALERARYPP